jgi:hypothetical protein
MEYDEIEPEIAIVVPRSEQMKPYYPALREWFAYHGLKWKDRSRNKQRFMFAYVDKDPAKLEALVRNMGTMVFNTEELKLNPRGALSVYMLSTLSNHLTLYSSVAIFGLLDLLALTIYEVFKIFSLSAPSILNIDRVEIWLSGLFVICMCLTRILEITPSLRGKSNGPSWSRLTPFLLLYGSFAMMFFTV